MHRIKVWVAIVCVLALIYMYHDAHRPLTYPQVAPLRSVKMDGHVTVKSLTMKSYAEHCVSGPLADLGWCTVLGVPWPVADDLPDALVFAKYPDPIYPTGNGATASAALSTCACCWTKRRGAACGHPVARSQPRAEHHCARGRGPAPHAARRTRRQAIVQPSRTGVPVHPRFAIEPATLTAAVVSAGRHARPPRAAAFPPSAPSTICPSHPAPAGGYETHPASLDAPR